MECRKISKKEAHQRFENGLRVFIGGQCADGTGAKWDASQFKISDFDALYDFFEQTYCRGVGRILYPTFYVKEVTP